MARRPDAAHEAALGAFDQALRTLDRAASTRRLYLATARRFLTGLQVPLGQVSSGDVVTYLAAREEQRLALWRRELYHLRGFFRALVDTGLLAASPAEGLSVGSRRPVPHAALATETVSALLDAAAGEPRRDGAVAQGLALRDRAALELLYGAGLRASEACAVQAVDLDLCAGALRVRPLKGGRQRTLPLPPASLPHMRRYQQDGRPLLVEADGRDEGRFLVSKSGRPLERSAVRCLVERVAARAGLHTYPHAIRRSVASHLVRDGAPVPLVQHLLGHRSLSSTARYVALDRADLRQAVERLERGGGPDERPAS